MSENLSRSKYSAKAWAKTSSMPPLRIFGTLSPYVKDNNDKPKIPRPERQGVKRGPYKKKVW